MKVLYFIGRLLSRIRWRNYLIPNRYWRLVLGKNFLGTYMGIPMYKTNNLEEDRK
ncbi:hypothetical protein LCGC14_1314040 [marine sediment metagenome]|uniref:Uncharacterized protein n=1 Tax=marine sediment metagenome TaxID=412755 RepID=A0A0F9KLE6_9ZZZZ